MLFLENNTYTGGNRCCLKLIVLNPAESRNPFRRRIAPISPLLRMRSDRCFIPVVFRVGFEPAKVRYRIYAGIAVSEFSQTAYISGCNAEVGFLCSSRFIDDGGAFGGLGYRHIHLRF